MFAAGAKSEGRAFFWHRWGLVILPSRCLERGQGWERGSPISRSFLRPEVLGLGFRGLGFSGLKGIQHNYALALEFEGWDVAV